MGAGPRPAGHRRGRGRAAPAVACAHAVVAAEAGARIYVETDVRRVVIEDGVATGVDAIIAQGKLLASGSLNELRKGISVDGDGQGPVSLEEYFIHVVGGTRGSNEEEVLQWLT